jgi:hypothetical protein
MAHRFDQFMPRQNPNLLTFCLGGLAAMWVYVAVTEPKKLFSFDSHPPGPGSPAPGNSNVDPAVPSDQRDVAIWVVPAMVDVSLSKRAGISLHVWA